MADMSYHEFTIQKKNGKTRKIVNPSASLKRYQRAQTPALYKHFLKAADHHAASFHGFIPGRNAVTGAKQHIGFQTTIMFDLVAFFDNVYYEHITDAGVLLNKQNQERLFHKAGYAAQGFPSSPMLANIAAIPLIWDLSTWLTTQFGNDFALTIYADDIQISFNDEAKSTWQLVRDTVYTTATNYRFAINPTKTRVRFAKYGARKILGLNVTDTAVIASRRTNRKVRALLHQVTHDTAKGQALGGMRTWQKCILPRKQS